MVNPSGYTALDLIGYTDKGTYSAAATYVKNDLVHYNGSIWRVLIDDTTGVTPTEGANYTIFVETPTDAFAESIAPVENAVSTHAYTIGQQLYYSDKLYRVIANIALGDTLIVGTNITESDKVTSQIQTLTNNVSTNTSNIGVLTDQISNSNDTYSNTKAYTIGNIVIQNNSLYRCIRDCSAADWIVNQNNFTPTTIAENFNNINSHIKFIDIPSAEMSNSNNPLKIAENMITRLGNSPEICYVSVADVPSSVDSAYAPFKYTVYEIRRIADAVTVMAINYQDSKIITNCRTYTTPWQGWKYFNPQN